MALLFGQISAVGHKLQVVRALRHRDFRWFWISTSAQAVGRGMQFLIIGWLVLELTDSSTTQLGLVVFLYGIPTLAFVLFGGIFADRVNRLKLLVVTQALVAVIIFTLATLTMSGLVALWHIYAATFLLGTLQAINMPARMAMVSDLVGREDLMNAVALNMAVMNSGRILGPTVAGGLIELTGIGPALYLNAGCYFVGTLFLFLVHHVPHTMSAKQATILSDLMAGLRFYWTTPVVFTVITMGFAMGFFGMPYVQILPAFAKEVLEVGAAGAGLLITGAGVGSLVGAIFLASLGNFAHKNWLLLGSIFTFGIVLFLFAWATMFWVAWGFLFVLGMTSMIPMGTTVLQLTVPAELQGRVLSLWYLSAGFMFVGALPMALLADAVNWTVAIGGGAALYLSVALWLGLWRPTLRRLKV